MTTEEFIEQVKRELEIAPIVHIHESEDGEDFGVIISKEVFIRMGEMIPRSDEATGLFMNHEHLFPGLHLA